MYIPKLSFAQSRIQIGNIGIVVLFDIFNFKHLSVDDPYRLVLHNLDLDGRHRNVFMVDNDGVPIWRVQDYELPFEFDSFISIRGTEEPWNYWAYENRKIDNSEVYIFGDTFCGFTFKINLADGTLSDRQWQMN